MMELGKLPMLQWYSGTMPMPMRIVIVIVNRTVAVTMVMTTVVAEVQKGG